MRREAARVSAARSVRLSAWAWGVLAAAWALSSMAALGAAEERWAPLVVVIAVQVVAIPVVFVVLTVLAVRAAWRGLDSGYSVSRWATALAWLDAIMSAVLVIGAVVLALALWSFHQCVTDPTCQLFQF